MKQDTIVKSATILMALTIVSKLFGFGREMVVASLFGASREADAWFLAAGVPLLLAGPVTAAM